MNIVEKVQDLALLAAQKEELIRNKEMIDPQDNQALLQINKSISSTSSLKAEVKNDIILANVPEATVLVNKIEAEAPSSTSPTSFVEEISASPEFQTLSTNTASSPLTKDFTETENKYSHAKSVKLYSEYGLSAYTAQKEAIIDSLGTSATPEEITAATKDVDYAITTANEAITLADAKMAEHGGNLEAAGIALPTTPENVEDAYNFLEKLENHKETTAVSHEVGSNFGKAQTASNVTLESPDGLLFSIPQEKSTLEFSRIDFDFKLDNTTNLLKGDPFDPRQYDLVFPFYYQEGVPAYFKLEPNLNSNPVGTSLLNASVNTSTPDFDNPFDANNSSRYNQFILRGLKESYSEKFQIVETLAGQVNFSFDEKPEVWSIYGNLINDVWSNWLTKFRQVWKESIRMSKLVEKGFFLNVVIPSLRLSFNCYPIALSVDHNPENEALPTFSMSMIIVSTRNIPSIQYNVRSASVSILESFVYLDSKNESL